MNIKNFISFVFCIAIVVCVSYFINAKGGIMLLVCLGCAFLISLADFLLVCKKISAKLSCENFNIRKGDVFSVCVTVSKNTFLPTPYVEIKFKNSPKLTPVSAEIFKTALFFPKDSSTIIAEYKAEFSGKSTVEIEYVRLTDYLGLFSRDIFMSQKNEVVNALVLPEIPDCIFTNDLLKSSGEAISYDDDEEDSGETLRFGNGLPGYEHRNYVPGDPVKKINWKLSSKRDIFLIRLDEKPSSTGRVLVLDIFSDTQTKETCRINDVLIEGCLGMLSQMLKNDLSCECWFYNESDWTMCEVNNEKTLLELQCFLQSYDDSVPHKTRLPQLKQKQKGSSASIIFTNNLDTSLYSLNNNPNYQNFYVTSEDAPNKHFENAWIINSLFEIKRV